VPRPQTEAAANVPARQPPVPAAPPAATPAADPAPPGIPDLPDITLSPTPLSSGPYAAVYRGWDRVHRCDVVVKVQRAGGDPVALERFRREGAVMARLRHPHIVALYHFHEGDPAAAVMEYVPGRTLAETVAADGWMPPERAARIVEDVAAALDAAHAQGIVHRDVKPENILLPRRGPARLTDFGVAHIDDEAPLTVMGDVLGTIEYASPEQVHGNETPDARSDVYSLAAVAYFALTGTPPFRAADNSTQAQLSVMHRQVFADPPPLRFHREDLSPDVERAVLRGLAKSPADRYPSAGQFAATLRLAAESASGAPEHKAMLASSRRTGALAGALAGATLLLMGGVAVWKTDHTARVAAPMPRTAERQPVRVPAHGPHPPRAPQRVAQALPMRGPLAPNTGGTGKPPAVSSLTPRLSTVAGAGGRSKTHPQPAHVAATQAPLARAVHADSTRTPRKAVVIRRLKPHRPARPAPRPFVVASHLKKRPPVVAVRPQTPPPRIAPTPVAPARGWLFVYASQDVARPGRPSRIAAIRPQAIYVDGRSVPDLAAGRWAALPPGRHVVSFFPDVRSGFGPRTNVAVTLSPGDHLSRQILLPVLTNVAGRPPAPRPSPSFASAPVGTGWLSVYGVRPVGGGWETLPALTVSVDGRPVPALAAGKWARLPSGRHIVTFSPQPGLEAGTASQVITLAPRAYWVQKVPLPAVPPPHLRNP